MRRLLARGKSENEAEQLVDTVDRERADFIQKYFRVEWPDRAIYHAMINTAIGGRGRRSHDTGFHENHRYVSRFVSASALLQELSARYLERGFNNHEGAMYPGSFEGDITQALSRRSRNYGAISPAPKR